MAKKIILLSDGTGNSAAKLFKTNVWRLYQSLDLSSSGQVAFYDDGVGTSSFKPLAILGGAFGWGLKRNVLDLYTFLCRNYFTTDQIADEIYAFGFSRGAFTIRVLLQFVLSQGLVANYTSNADLRRKALRLYRKFRAGRTTRFGLASAARAVRDAWIWLLDHVIFAPASLDIRVQTVTAINFVGLWDTVDAYGVPVEELKNGIDRYIWPLALHDPVLDDRIRKAYHALSLDDQRTTFHPLLWDEADLQQYPNVNQTQRERLTQVWFAGVHANVGGGYPDDGLSLVSLKWMIREAQRQGLKFNDEFVRMIYDSAAPYGRCYDSRSGLSSYYRYAPRLLDPPRDKHGAQIPSPKIHESVIWRMAVGTDGYAPLSLPTNMRIVAESFSEDRLITQNVDLVTNQAAELVTSEIMSFADYGTAVENAGNSFYVNVLRGQDPHAINLVELESLKGGFHNLAQADQTTLNLIWETVWWRRVAYFAIVGATIAFSVFPFLPSLDSFFDQERLAALEAIAQGPAAGISGVLSGFLPSIAKPWIDALRLSPWFVAGLVGAIALCFVWGHAIDHRINDRALGAWQTGWRERRLAWFHQAMMFRQGASLLLILAILALGIFLGGSRVLPSSFTILALVIAGGAGVYFFMLRHLDQSATQANREVPGLALTIARRVLNSSLINRFYEAASRSYIPAIFAAGLVVTFLYAANKTGFHIMSAGGWICQSTAKPIPMPDQAVTRTFDLKNGCGASGLVLAKSQKYVIEVTNADGWKDNEIDAQPRPALPFGFSTPVFSHPQMLLGVPIRRMLTELWFVPVVRIGRTGGDEHVLGVGANLIEPSNNGELFFFVNDAVIGLPGVWDYFYRNNGGTATISVRPAK